MILEAAAQVFRREGLDATTNRIAERAGVSIGSLYQYFPNKQALLYGLAEQHLGHAEQRVREVFAGLRDTAAPWPDVVRTLVLAVVALHTEQPFPHALMFEHTPRTEAGLARLHGLLEYAAGELAVLLRRHARGGPDHDTTASLLVHAVDAQVHRVVLAGEHGVAERAEAVIALWTALPRDGTDGTDGAQPAGTAPPSR